MATLDHRIHPLFSTLKSSSLADEPVEFTLLAPARGDLRALAAELDSRHFGRREYPPREEIARLYGADEGAVAELEGAVSAAGLTLVNDESASRGGALAAGIRRRLIRCRASAKQVEDLFEIDLRRYEVGSRAFLGHTKAVELRGALAKAEWVFGLDQRALVRPDLLWQPKREGVGQRSFTAPEVAALYDYPALDGAGQCVGVIAFGGGYLERELSAYFDHAGVVRSAPIVASGVNRRGPVVLSDMETTMNTQILASVCPAAKVVVYLGATRTYDLEDYFELWLRAIFDLEHRPAVLSNSWSWPEGTVSSALLAKFDELFAAAKLMGISICASSGNSGAISSTVDSEGLVMPAAPRVRFPSGHPDVLACGGTTIRATTPELGEVVLNKLAHQLEIRQESGPAASSQIAAGMASTGGVSQLWPPPSYQAEAGVPKLLSYVWRNGELSEHRVRRGRGVPDVAANADLHSGYDFVFLHGGEPPEDEADADADATTVEGLVVGGGTSAATPMWAALLTLIGQAVGGPLGRPHDALYEFGLGGRGLRQITRGNNGGYEAHPDLIWNACTGLGTPSGTALAEAWRAALDPSRAARDEGKPS